MQHLNEVLVQMFCEWWKLQATSPGPVLCALLRGGHVTPPQSRAHPSRAARSRQPQDQGPRVTDWEAPRESLWVRTEMCLPGSAQALVCGCSPPPSAQSAECWSRRSEGLGEGRRQGLRAGTVGGAEDSGFWIIWKNRFYSESSLEAKHGSTPPPTKDSSPSPWPWPNLHCPRWAPCWRGSRLLQREGAGQRRGGGGGKGYKRHAHQMTKNLDWPEAYEAGMTTYSGA